MTRGGMDRGGRAAGGPGRRRGVGTTKPDELSELHVHLEGTVSRETAVELAREHGELPPPLYEYSDLDGFFAVYFPVAHLMRTAVDFERVVVEHAAAMARDGVAYAEVSFNPALHPGTSWIEGLERGRRRAQRDFAVQLAWLVELVRGADSNQRALEIAIATPGVVGLGLVGDESIPAQGVAPIVAAARRQGLRLMAHAGQTGGPEVVRDAVQLLSADRIAHGVSAIRDASLRDLIVRRDVCLCVCPSSNRRIGLRPDYRALANAGISLCVNTDDPAIVGTTLPAELEIATAGGLDRQSLVANAARYRFAEVGS
jgi:aminodeoxyfutalosine deaminase